MLRRLHVRATPNHSLLTNNCLQVYYALAYDNDTNPTTPSSLYHQSFNNTRLHGPWKEPKRQYNHSGSFFHPLLLRGLKTHILSRFFFFFLLYYHKLCLRCVSEYFFFPSSTTRARDACLEPFLIFFYSSTTRHGRDASQAFFKTWILEYFM